MKVVPGYQGCRFRSLGILSWLWTRSLQPWTDQLKMPVSLHRPHNFTAHGKPELYIGGFEFRRSWILLFTQPTNLPNKLSLRDTIRPLAVQRSCCVYVLSLCSIVAKQSLNITILDYSRLIELGFVGLWLSVTCNTQNWIQLCNWPPRANCLGNVKRILAALVVRWCTHFTLRDISQYNLT